MGRGRSYTRDDTVAGDAPEGESVWVGRCSLWDTQSTNMGEPDGLFGHLADSNLGPHSQWENPYR